MDVPSSWLVRPREALYDLDNIQLGSLATEDRIRGVEAVFALDYLVIEGHARNTATNSPPRGLQLQLTKGNAGLVDDTQVVANLGYFQFKAQPGVFQMDIREGPGRDVYMVESVGNEGWDSPTVELVGNAITLTSFEGLTLYPRMVKRPGMETQDVLSQYTDERGRQHQPEGSLGQLFSKYVLINPSISGVPDIITQSQVCLSHRTYCTCSCRPGSGRD
jgi:UDP-glucose:glycoprotein glucosyltransferase